LIASASVFDIITTSLFSLNVAYHNIYACVIVETPVLCTIRPLKIKFLFLYVSMSKHSSSPTFVTLETKHFALLSQFSLKCYNSSPDSSSIDLFYVPFLSRNGWFVP